MKRLIITLLSGLTLLLAAGCHNDENPMGTLGKTQNSYVITILDQNGTAIALGTLSWEPPERDIVEGSWMFEASEARDNINNPFEGQGNLEGNLKNDSLAIDLHPGWADNNIYLNGIAKGDSLNGTWAWVGFPGIIEQGRFLGVSLEALGD